MQHYQRAKYQISWSVIRQKGKPQNGCFKKTYFVFLKQLSRIYVNMQKNSLFNLFTLEIQPILKSRDQSGRTHFWTSPTKTKNLFSFQFHEFASHSSYWDHSPPFSKHPPLFNPFLKFWFSAPFFHSTLFY